MKPVLLIDFGSTYTKVTAADLEKAEIIGTASAYTTVETDINNGLDNAMALLTEKCGKIEFGERYACSSAAGGLRMCASGLVPELTTEAARLASLGAGAKVIKSYAYELTKSDIREIERLAPDIFLLTGGTDGGNTECIIHNAGMIAQCSANFPILLSGNRSAVDRCEELLADREVYTTPNVMPKLGELNIDPVKDKIREVFLERIVSAKGLTKATELINDILIPTPAAVLEAMLLLSNGTKNEPGIGELLAVDLGGATTDVYSMAKGFPEIASTVLKGFNEPFQKRTVEGDTGMRYSAVYILENAGAEKLSELSGIPESRVCALIENFKEDYGRLPDTEELEKLDFALASCAIDIAVKRHAGTLEEVFTPMGLVLVQTGKDLRKVSSVIFTGGALIHAEDPMRLLPCALYNPAEPGSLKPREAELYLDKKYVLSAMGLLGKHYPDTALQIMKKELTNGN